jgi:hypothetical protein
MPDGARKEALLRTGTASFLPSADEIAPISSAVSRVPAKARQRGLRRTRQRAVPAVPALPSPFGGRESPGRGRGLEGSRRAYWHTTRSGAVAIKRGLETGILGRIGIFCWYHAEEGRKEGRKEAVPVLRNAVFLAPGPGIFLRTLDESYKKYYTMWWHAGHNFSNERIR